ncbi:MAG: phage head-tail joining protein [Sphingomonas parapaucimobilis]
MSTPAERIAKLEEALGNGVLTIESDGERITYRSTSDLKDAILYNQTMLARGELRRPASTVAVFDPS